MRRAAYTDPYLLRIVDIQDCAWYCSYEEDNNEVHNNEADSEGTVYLKLSAKQTVMGNA